MRQAAPETLLWRHLDRGRALLPAEWRRDLGLPVGVWADLCGCVLIAPRAALDDALRGLQATVNSQQHSAELVHFLSSTFAEVEPDDRGRLVLPLLHREWAGLSADGPAALLRVGAQIQVWEPRRLKMVLGVASRVLHQLDSHPLREQMSLFPYRLPE
jgi:DNA-binding transcriptional regulator/RsmH inhibitor MraZ